MNPFDLLVVWLATRIQLPERLPKPNARRDDFPRGADAVPDLRASRKQIAEKFDQSEFWTDP